jgi:O-antigen/teichoic acid export membrane protein
VVTLINAMQKPAFASLFDTLTQALNAIIIVILAQCTEGSLLYLALTMCGSSFLVLGIGNSYIFSHELKAYTPDMRFIDFKVTKDILSLSIKFFLLQIIAIAIYQTNNIIITNILGPLEVTIYSIAHKYMSILAMLYSIILAPFWSGFVEARTKDDYAWMRRATSKLRKIFFMFSIFGLLMVLASPVFFRYWLRGSVEIPLIITCLMYIYHIINIWGTLHTQLLAGFGKIKLQLLVSSIAGIMIIPVSIGLARYFGLQGLIIGNILVFLPFGSWFGFVQINKLLHKKAQGIWNE